MRGRGNAKLGLEASISDQISSNWAQIWPRLGPNVVEGGTDAARFRPSSARVPPNFARTCPNSGNFGGSWTRFGQCLTKFGRCWLTSTTEVPISSKFGGDGCSGTGAPQRKAGGGGRMWSREVPRSIRARARASRGSLAREELGLEAVYAPTPSVAAGLPKVRPCAPLCPAEPPLPTKHERASVGMSGVGQPVAPQPTGSPPASAGLSDTGRHEPPMPTEPALEDVVGSGEAESSREFPLPQSVVEGDTVIFDKGGSAGRLCCTFFESPFSFGTDGRPVATRWMPRLAAPCSDSLSSERCHNP